MTSKVFLRATILCAAVLAFTSPFTSPALSQPKPVPHIEYAEIVSSGFSGPSEPVKRGKLRQRLFSRTLLVTDVKVGAKFTMAVRPVGQPDGAEVAIRWVWRTPRPGIKDDKTGKLTREIGEDATVKLGEEMQKTFEFRSEEQIIKGTWRAEVWNGGRKLATRGFAIR